MENVIGVLSHPQLNCSREVVPCPVCGMQVAASLLESHATHCASNMFDWYRGLQAIVSAPNFTFVFHSSFVSSFLLIDSPSLLFIMPGSLCFLSHLCYFSFSPEELIVLQIFFSFTFTLSLPSLTKFSTSSLLSLHFSDFWHFCLAFSCKSFSTQVTLTLLLSTMGSLFLLFSHTLHYNYWPFK